MGSGDMTVITNAKHSLTIFEGSLTTPTCDEVVTWTVFETPIKMKADTFAALTQSTGVSDPITKNPNTPSNYRNVQPLNGRKINYYKKVHKT